MSPRIMTLINLVTTSSDMPIRGEEEGPSSSEEEDGRYHQEWKVEDHYHQDSA